MSSKKEIDRRYYLNHPDKIKIKEWKRRGVKLRDNEDWESVYLYYRICEECEICSVKLTDEKINTITRRCLDHNHDTGFIRHICCLNCNIKIK